MSDIGTIVRKLNKREKHIIRIGNDIKLVIHMEKGEIKAIITTNPCLSAIDANFAIFII